MTLAPIENAPAPRRFAAFLVAAMTLSATGAVRAETSAVRDGNVVVLQNEHVRVAYDLASGSYSACSRTDKSSNITCACLRIDEIPPDAAGLTRTWESAKIKDELGTGQKLLIKA
ncbi:MAG: hypothetical protein NTY19_08760 [Planctomycetota bacterium]|nr:hypothetical protein [Planctomycetota bacterium]